MQKKVLICDDNEGIIEIINIILTDKGYSTEICNEGGCIIDTVKEFNPDVILLDLWMPNMNGDEIINILKNAEEYKHIPIIIVSANKDTEAIAKQIKADNFLCKPFNIDDLENMVDSYLFK